MRKEEKLVIRIEDELSTGPIVEKMNNSRLTIWRGFVEDTGCDLEVNGGSVSKSNQIISRVRVRNRRLANRKRLCRSYPGGKGEMINLETLKKERNLDYSNFRMDVALEAIEDKMSEPEYRDLCESL